MPRIKSSDLAAMPPDAKRKALAALANPTDEEKARAQAVLRARIRQFEIRYEMSSDEMVKGFAKGEVRDTAEINQWRVLLDALNGHRPNGASPESA